MFEWSSALTTMHDKIFDGFLKRQHEEGMALARESDLLELMAETRWPPQRYAALFRAKGLVRTAGGEVVESDHFEVGISFPQDYLRRADPVEVLTWFGPGNVFHPNIAAPFICIGRLAPGTPLVEILYQCFEIITYNKVTMREDDALNKDACEWARKHLDLLPVDTRPLRRRTLDIEVEPE
jgi:hypothetical protein